MSWYKCVLVAVVALTGIPQSLGQGASSSAAAAAASSLAPAAAAAKPLDPKKTSTPPDRQYLIKLYDWEPRKVVAAAITGQPCFAGPLQFSVTNASDMAKKLSGLESGYSLTAISPGKLALYYKGAARPPAIPAELDSDIEKLAGGDFDRAIAIPVPRSLADKALSQLKLPDDGSIAVKQVDAGCVLLLSKKEADPVAVAALQKNIRRLYWIQSATPPTQRLFYIDANAVAKNLSGAKTSSPDTSGSGSGSDASSKPKDPSAGGSVTASSTLSPTVSISVVPGPPATAKATADGSGGDSSDSGNPTDGSAAGSTDPASSNKTPATKPSAPGKSNPPKPDAPAKPPTMTPVNDMLVYSNDDGSDTGFFERNRLMAVLDLPRPEVLMNIWSLQASSRKYEIVTAEADAARELVAHHNDLLQQAIDNGWGYLSRQMVPNGAFFDPMFYWYVTEKFGETDGLVGMVSQKTAENTTAPTEQEKADVHSTAGRVKTLVENNRRPWGWCDSSQYCLGFSRAFEPLRPTFTNILIGIIAARDPYHAATETVTKMEQSMRVRDEDPPCLPKFGDQNPCKNPDRVEAFQECMAGIDGELRTFKGESSSCELGDRIAMSDQILTNQPGTIALKCFRRQVEESFGPTIPGDNRERARQYADYATTRPGLLRAAVADFLFNYKWATQYPHDFIPYDLTQSAQELNAEFNPLVLAFNRDVSAFTQNLQAELHCRYEADIKPEESNNWFKKGDETFINDGMLSVRGISGVNSIADTVTQSFFDATNPPSLTDLVKSVSDAEKNIPGVLKTNLTANEAAVLLGALNSVQPAEAKIGRELKLDITPHALAGASSAELEVKLTAEEVGNPTLYKADKSTEDTLSRVAKHDVTTRVRVESTKLFEISAFSATLQRPRSKFPILPPLFEVPYFGSFIGWPLPGAHVYHRSTAIVSAVIVPTAADLAFGIDFSADRLCDENGCHRATSPKDFGLLPLRNFHKAVITCLASGGKVAFTGLNTTPSISVTDAESARNPCKNLSLSEYLQATPGNPPVPPTD